MMLRPLALSLFAASLLALTPSCATTSSGAGAESAAGASAPDFDIELVNGEKFRLSDHRGKVVVIDFWATYCQPCIPALGHLQHFHDKLKDKGLVVIAVATDQPDTAGGIVPFARSHNLTMPVAHDAQSRITDLYNKKSVLPYQVLIGRDGKIIKTRDSYQPGDETGIEADIVAALDKK